MIIGVDACPDLAFRLLWEAKQKRCRKQAANIPSISQEERLSFTDHPRRFLIRHREVTYVYFPSWRRSLDWSILLHINGATARVWYSSHNLLTVTFKIAFKVYTTFSISRPCISGTLSVQPDLQYRVDCSNSQKWGSKASLSSSVYAPQSWLFPISHTTQDIWGRTGKSRQVPLRHRRRRLRRHPDQLPGRRPLHPQATTMIPGSSPSHGPPSGHRSSTTSRTSEAMTIQAPAMCLMLVINLLLRFQMSRAMSVFGRGRSRRMDSTLKTLFGLCGGGHFVLSSCPALKV